MLFKTFKARIHGANAMTIGNDAPLNTLITFSKRKIILQPTQINNLYYDAIGQFPINDKSEYDFDKLLNKEDEKMFSIILKKKRNEFDSGIYHLDINTWNKIKANIIHHRYWLDREKEWFAKTLIATLIGAIFGLMGAYLGYRLGFQNGKATIIKVQQEQTPPSRR